MAEDLDALIREAEEAQRAQERLWEEEHDEELELLRELEEEDVAPPAKRKVTPTRVGAGEGGNGVALPVAAPRAALGPINGAAQSSRQREKAKRRTPHSEAPREFNPYDESSDEGEDEEEVPGKRLRAHGAESSPGDEAPDRSGRLLASMPLGKSVSMVSSEGKRFYLRIDDRSTLARSREPSLTRRRGVGLLEKPFSHIKREVDDARSAKTHAAAEKVAAQLAEMDAIFGDGSRGARVDEGESDDELDKPARQNKERIETELWVNKFSPRRYVDLVSSEKENRALLGWLKTWDKKVFNREPRKSRGKGPRAVGGGGLAAAADTNEPEAVPPVVLLSGPPGVGKTTLAHIVARHCGYNVVEINASNDRSVDAFRTNIHNAVQMQGVLNFDGRPNCLVLDEIDGATKAAVNVLVGMATARASPTTGEGAAKKKRKGPAPLRRPVICICNDLFAPSLRSLRKVALEIALPPLTSRLLTNRLGDVCKMAGVFADPRSLAALCEATSGDIRSCLSTLQFAVAKTKRFSMDAVSEFLGQKDKNIGIFTVFDKIFNKRDSGGGARQSKRARQSGRSVPFSELLPLVQANGQYSKLIEGCYESFLTTRTTGYDPTMSKVLAFNDWLTFDDEVSATIGRTQAFALMAYQPFAMLACHVQFAGPSRHVVRYPSLFWAATQKANESSRVLDGMLDECHPSIRRMVNQQIVALDIVSPLLDLITPAIRPVAPALLSPTEKSVLEGVICTMVAYNLSYKQSRTEHASYKYALDPPIDTLVTFSEEGVAAQAALPSWKRTASVEESDKVIARGKRMTYNTKQIICQEIVQRQLGKAGTGEARSASVEHAASMDVDPVSTESPPNSDGVPRTKEEKDAFLRARMGIQMDHVTVKPSRMAPVDFFGRERAAPEPVSPSQTVQLPPAPLVFFKFHEGFSNAVKKPLRLRDLL